MKALKHYLILTLTACFFATNIMSSSQDDLARINRKSRIKIFNELCAQTDHYLVAALTVGMGIFLGSTIPQAIQNSQNYSRSIQQGRICLQQKAQQTSPCHCACPQQVTQPGSSSPYFSDTIAQTIAQKLAVQNYYDLARTFPENPNTCRNIPWFAVSNEN